MWAFAHTNWPDNATDNPKSGYLRPYPTRVEVNKYV
jgi:hypothetical protein